MILNLFFSIILFILIILLYILYLYILNSKKINEKDIPKVKWPFINLQDENGENINMLCVRGPIENKEDIDFFNKSLKKGIKFLGCSSYLSFPGVCLNKHGNCHKSMEFKGKPYYHKDYVLGWAHGFRNPDKYINNNIPKILLSESDFIDNMKLINDNSNIIYDFAVYCPKDKECDKGWNHHNKNWDLCKKTIETLCNKFNQKGILIGRKDCKIDLENPETLEKVDFLKYYDFIDKVKQSKFVIIPSFEDSSPRTITEALTMNKPILVNKNILAGWKYVNDKTGIFYDESDMKDKIDIFLNIINENKYEPRKYFYENYGIQISGKQLRDFLKSIYPDLSDCKLVKFPIS